MEEDNDPKTPTSQVVEGLPWRRFRVGIEHYTFTKWGVPILLAVGAWALHDVVKPDAVLAVWIIAAAIAGLGAILLIEHIARLSQAKRQHKSIAEAIWGELLFIEDDAVSNAMHGNSGIVRPLRLLNGFMLAAVPSLLEFEMDEAKRVGLDSMRLKVLRHEFLVFHDLVNAYNSGDFDEMEVDAFLSYWKRRLKMTRTLAHYWLSKNGFPLSMPKDSKPPDENAVVSAVGSVR